MHLSDLSPEIYAQFWPRGTATREDDWGDFLCRILCYLKTQKGPHTLREGLRSTPSLAKPDVPSPIALLAVMR